MKKVCLFGLVIFFSFSSRSQINVSNQGSRYMFSLSPTPGNRHLNEGKIGNASADGDSSCAFVFEFGDGYFTTNINSEHRYKKAGDKTAVLSLSGRYDTVRPPRHHAKFINVLPDPDPNYEPSADSSYQPLLKQAGITITPIASDLNARDEMLFIITYRLEPGATGQLYFFYNHPGFDMMEPVQLGSSITISTGETFPRIRTHFEETSFTPSSWQLGQILSRPEMRRNDYKNTLAWNVNTHAGITERNIFISIPTKDNIALATGYFEAVLAYTTVNEQKRMIASLPMESSARPHDPNYISMIPDCIKMDGRTKPVNFHIHFENEGTGPAYRIRVDATIGKALLPRIRKNSLKVMVGGREVSPPDYEYTVLTPDSFQIHIKLPSTDRWNATIGRTLEGNNISNWQVNPLTMGDIYFTVDVPTTYEADFAATASITLFDHKDEDMPPEITETRTLRIRKDCNKSLLAPIRIPQDCTCNMFLALCWWWWVIIGLIALLILLLLFIRTRRKNIDRR